MRELVHAFWGLISGHRGRLGVALIGLALASGFALLSPAATKVAIDYVLTDNPGPSGLPSGWGLPTDRFALLLWLCGALVVVALLELLFSMWSKYHITRVQKRVAADLRRRTFEHAVRLPLHRIHQLRSGGLSSLLRGDAGSVGELIGSMLAGPSRALIRLVGTLVILASIDWLFLVGSLVLLPVVALSHRTWIGRIRPMWRQVRKQRSWVDGMSTEVFSAIRVVRAFVRERGEAGRFTTESHLMVRQEMRSWWWMRGIDIVWALLVPVASTGVLLYGGWRVIEGELTLGDVMMFSTYLLMLLGPIEALVHSATQIQNGLAGLDRVLDVLEEEREFAGSPGSTKLFRDEVKGAFTLRGVGFTYPGSEREVLKDIDLDVAAGETIALVGASGAGKTTLTHLLARFYDPSRGEVRFDGHPLPELDVESYRQLFAVVEQDVLLFDGTVAENIAYGRPRASAEEIEHAARQAFAHEFILELDDGYATRIGERGVRLSGGQRQRLAIARALLADPAVLILDEATSNLDAESEARIKASLEELMEGRTAFVIAHRLSTIRKADRVVVLEQGEVVEQGTHDELLAREGRYFELLGAQLETPAERAELHQLVAAGGG